MASVSEESNVFPYEGKVRTGNGCFETKLVGEPITIYTSKPEHTTDNDILLLFDGMKRNAVKINRKAKRLSEKYGLILFAPLMSVEQFPKWRYELAGVIRKRQILPTDDHTAAFIQRLIDFACEATGSKSSRVHLFGHSAGGQLLSRACAYSNITGAHSIVISNPSSYAIPDMENSVPFGFKGYSTPDISRLKIRGYLASPITIYLGMHDTGSFNLSQSKGAQRQGTTRLGRGRFVYKKAKRIAAENNWEFNWKLIEVAGVGHSSRAMLEAEECHEALRL